MIGRKVSFTVEDAQTREPRKVVGIVVTEYSDGREYDLEIGLDNGGYVILPRGEVSVEG